MVEIKEVLLLWLGGQAKKAIARQMGLDPKTVRSYIAAAEAAGLARGREGNACLRRRGQCAFRPTDCDMGEGHAREVDGGASWSDELPRRKASLSARNRGGDVEVFYQLAWGSDAFDEIHDGSKRGTVFRQVFRWVLERILNPSQGRLGVPVESGRTDFHFAPVFRIPLEAQLLDDSRDPICRRSSQDMGRDIDGRIRVPLFLSDLGRGQGHRCVWVVREHQPGLGRVTQPNPFDLLRNQSKRGA